MANIVFKAPTPDLLLECTGSRAAGRCYTITTYKVTSTKRLPRSVFDGLREAGLLGYGQGFSVSSPVEEPQLLVPVALDVSDREVARGYDKVTNPYSGAPYNETYRTVYVYTITSECDSGD